MLGNNGGLRRADLGVGRDETLLGLADIRTALEQLRGQSRRHGCRCRLDGECETARDIGGITAEQCAQQILLLRELALEIGNGLGGGVNQLFGLAHIEQGGRAVLRQYLREVQGVLARGQRVARDLQREVELTDLEIGAGNARDHRIEHRALSPFGGEPVGPCRLGLTAIFAPEIEVPDGRQTDLRGVGIVGRKHRGDLGVALGEGFGTGIDRRKLIRARDAELRLRLQHARGRDAHIVILSQRRAEQLLQHRVVKYFRPLLRPERGGGVRAGRSHRGRWPACRGPAGGSLDRACSPRAAVRSRAARIASYQSASAGWAAVTVLAASGRLAPESRSTI